MEGFTVKHVQEVEEKGVQQVEQELLDKHNKDLENQNNEVQDELKKRIRTSRRFKDRRRKYYFLHKGKVR